MGSSLPLAMITIMAMLTPAAAADRPVPRSSSSHTHSGLSRTLRAFPEIDHEILRAEDEDKERSGARAPMRIGVPLTVEAEDVIAEGSVTQGDQGSIVTYCVDSPGALSLQFSFEQVDLCLGCEMYLYPYTPADGTYGKAILYSHSKHHRAPPRPDGKAVTPPIAGPTACIEVFIPTGGAQPSVVLHRVDHLYKDLLQMSKDESLSGDISKVFQDSPTQSCENNVNCFEMWDAERRAVALITIPTPEGLGVCTGSLLNNMLGSTQIFLTASHCYENNAGQIMLDSVSGTGFFFNGETFNCSTNDGPSPSELDQVSGAMLLSNAPDSTGVDFCLLEIAQPIPAEFNLYYLGWDARDIVPNLINSLTIHHPSADYKKISFDQDPPTTGGFDIPNQWVVRWDSGVTSQGSSGSPLLQPSTGRVIGQLRAGKASCEFPDEPDYYGKVANAYFIGFFQNLGVPLGLRVLDGTFNPNPMPPPPSPPLLPEPPNNICSEPLGPFEVIDIALLKTPSSPQCVFDAANVINDGFVDVKDVIRIFKELNT